MPGLRLTLPVTFTDTTLPVVKEDPLLPDAGALMLADMSTAAAGSAIPATIPNLAWRQAKAALGGAGTEASLAAAYSVRGAPAANQLKMERTSKGGIHGLVSKTNKPAVGVGASVDLPQALGDYIYDNVTHLFYMSLWNKPTRLASSGTVGAAIFGVRDTSFLWYDNQSGAGWPTNYISNLPTTGAPTAGTNRHTSVAPPGTWYSAFNTTQAAGSRLAKVDAIYRVLFGNVSPQNNNGDSAFSQVFYRLYVEDLTVSGRSAGTVRAADQAAWTAAFATGGRFNGDTHTDPATFA